MARILTPEYREAFTRHLLEAMPYMRKFHGATIVIKYGGAAMVEPGLREEFVRDLVMLSTVGMRPVVVHGGGPMISEMMKRLGKTPEFIDGQRITDADTVEITEMVLCGTVNGQIVDGINALGGRAVGLSGKDGGLLVAHKQRNSSPSKGDVIDLGYVGEVTAVNAEVIAALEERGFIPVISPLASNPEDRVTYNINADTVAGAIAGALKARRLVLVSDQDGVLRDRTDPASLITEIKTGQLEQLIGQGIIQGGMIPKVRACAKALTQGVHKAHLINGKTPHSLLLELFTDEGVGTQIVQGN